MIALVLASILLQSPPASEAPSGSVVVIVPRAHIRSGAGLQSPILGTLKRGTLLAVSGREGNWLHVRVTETGLEGFVLETLVERAPGATTPPVAPAPLGAPASPGGPPSVASPSPSPVETGNIAGSLKMVVRGGGFADDLSDAVAYLVSPGPVPAPSQGTIDMKSKEFLPHVLVVGVGSRVDFPNLDPILHNVFSPSTGDTFDLGLYMRPEKGGFVFRHPGFVRIYCNIHPQMSAVVVVRDNPYFAKVAPGGAFRIQGVPTGHYTLRVWHEQADGEKAAVVTVPPGGTVAAALTLDASSYQEQPHKRKDGKDYTATAGRP